MPRSVDSWGRSSNSLAWIAAILVFAATHVTTVVALPYVGACLETCCCTVCSSATSQSFPYGLTTPPLAGNPLNPVVTGATCRVPLWSERVYNDTNGNAVTSPQSFWWTSFAVFGDTAAHEAPFTCDCCQFSGVHTSCAEVAPIAAAPQQVVFPTNYIISGSSTIIIFKKGVQLSTFDHAEMRTNTLCGYGNATMNTSSAGTTRSVNVAQDEATWIINTLPAAGCYRLCYYHSNLTSPGWYYIGEIIIQPAVAAVASFVPDPDDVLLTGNDVTLTFRATKLLNPWNDYCELRTGSCAGAIVASTQTGTNGQLDVMPGAVWCVPAVKPKITSVRPLNYIAIKYTDCTTENRVMQTSLQWKIVLPAAGTYRVCYFNNGTTSNIGPITIAAQAAADVALKLLYASAGGSGWKARNGWQGTSACSMAGVTCNSLSQVTGLYLGRNNLRGTIPPGLFLASYFKTLTHLKLDMNVLTGGIPNEIGALRNLRFLDLGFNQLTGTVPTTLRRTQLQAFYLNANQFAGTLPSEIVTLSQQWFAQTQLYVPTPNATVNFCPTDSLICSDRGSTDNGVFPCGYQGITKAECVAMQCCFNSQAPLTFGGTACFTKKSVNYDQYPQCRKVLCLPQF